MIPATIGLVPFIEASCHFIPFLIGMYTKADVVFILLVLLVDVLFQTFQRVGSTVKEAVIPHVLAVYVMMVVYAMMIVMEVVDEEVAEIPVDVALANEPEGYTVMVKVVDKEAADILVDLALADEAEGYMVTEEVDEEVADIPVDLAVASEPEGYPVQTCCILGII